jgi:hypothetical protein
VVAHDADRRARPERRLPAWDGSSRRVCSRGTGRVGASARVGRVESARLLVGASWAGNGRRALVSMSHKSPSVTGPVMLPVGSSRLRPQQPHHPAAAAGCPAVRTLVSELSRSPRGECVGEVLRPGGEAAQEGAATFLRFHTPAACRPQTARGSSTASAVPPQGHPQVDQTSARSGSAGRSPSLPHHWAGTPCTCGAFLAPTSAGIPGQPGIPCWARRPGLRPPRGRRRAAG